MACMCLKNASFHCCCAEGRRGVREVEVRPGKPATAADISGWERVRPVAIQPHNMTADTNVVTLDLLFKNFIFLIFFVS